jgi:ATP synthase protein I
LKPPHQQNKTNAWLKYAGIGTEMVLVIFLFTFIGHRLDKHLQMETPWWTILMLFAGLAFAFYLVYKQLK